MKTLAILLVMNLAPHWVETDHQWCYVEKGKITQENCIEKRPRKPPQRQIYCDIDCANAMGQAYTDSFAPQFQPHDYPAPQYIPDYTYYPPAYGPIPEAY